ncbi:MAG TPA: peptidylprolyl isomerase [Steroidobacteraceae bacterium]|nr:peptidylprolyl isomerase [Steroidobacteraceae bacterium]
MQQIFPSARARLCAAAVLALALSSLAACAKKPQTAAPAAANAAPGAVATVDGTPISRDAYDFYVKSLTGGKDPSQLTADQRSQVLDELISMQLMAQQAVKDGLQKDPDTAAQIDIARIHLLANAESQKYLKDKEPTDQEMQAEYASAVGKMDKTEYHARHILVANKDLALALIKRLQAGANFAELAKANSIDSSKTNGGDLGWFQASRMVKPFAAALQSLKPGQFTQQPVQTQFGWHIIQLLGTRPVTPPPFDQVKGQVANLVLQKKLRAYVDQLKKTATIQKNL